jgi:hypothetical protein
MNLVTSPEQFEDKLRQALTRESENLQPKQNELERIAALIMQTEKEADEIGRAISKTKGLVAPRLEQQAHEIDRRYQALTARKAE